MKYRKFNKYEKKEVRRQIIENALHGEGIYLFRNNSNADLTLPRPTKSGIKVVGPNKEFQGDNYYMQLVRSGMLRLVKEIQAPQTNTEVIMEEKLILDQPDTITTKGKVEHVVATPEVKMNENKNSEPKPDVLLNEAPADGGFVIVG